MQYSPKLKSAMEQIKKILVQNDIGAVVILHTPGHAEYLHHLTPSYSCAWIEYLHDGHAVRFRSTLADHFNDPVRRDRFIRDTINMISCFSERLTLSAMQFVHIEQRLQETIPFENKKRGESSHDQQNN